MNVNSSTIAIHNGKEAGQEIPHVHIHIIPRKRGDGAGPVHSMFSNRPDVRSIDMSSLVEDIQKNL
jgi:histidine triad (HIT) family protein